MHGKAARCLGASVAGLLCLGLCVPTAASASPPNDDFANAQQLSGPLPIEVSGSNVGATHQVEDPVSDDHSAGHSIWFRWESNSAEDITIGTCGSEIPTILGVYAGGDLDGLTEVASSRYSEGPNCAYVGSEVTFRAKSGTAYSIEVDGNAFRFEEPPVSGEGAIELQIRAQVPPANDDFANAQTLAPKSADAPAGNWGATKESGEPDHRGNQGGASVWFNWTAPRTEGAFARACGGPVDSESVVAVYTGNAVNALTPVAPIESWGNCQFAFMAIAGVTYRIAVDGEYNAAVGTANMTDPDLSVGLFPENDDFEDAKDFSFAKGHLLAIGYGTIGATKQPGEPDHAGNSGGASVWFNWTAQGAGSLRISACSDEFPTLLAVYTGSSLANLTPLAASGNPQGPGCLGLGEGEGQVGVDVDAGTTYRIAVDGRDGSWGKFILSLTASDERLKTPAPQPEVTPTRKRPNTSIARRRVDQPHRVAVFSLRSSRAGARFFCKLDSHRFKACGSTVVYRHLKQGRHTFRAKAVDGAGIDATPAVFHFRIRRER